MTTRRGFLGSILAAAAAPAIITTPGLLMPLGKVLPPTLVLSGGEVVTLLFDGANWIVLDDACKRASLAGKPTLTFIGEGSVSFGKGGNILLPSDWRPQART